MRTSCLAAVVAVSAFAATPALAQSSGSCCLQSTSRLDALLNPPTGSDEAFFTSGGVAPGVMFLLGTNVTMQDYPVPLPTAGADGCADPAVVTAMGFVDIASPLAALNGSIPADPDPDFGAGIQFFDKDKYYPTRNNRLEIGVGLNSDFRTTNGSTSAATACAVHSFPAACSTCLASVGWYKGASNRWIVSGRVLNVAAPKFVVARKVLKDTIDTVGNVRMGVAVFGPNTGYYDQPTLVARMKPDCDQSQPFVEGTFRNDMKLGINQVRFTNTERSVGEALFGLGAMYSSQVVDNRWTTWFRNGSNNPVAAPTNYPGSPAYGDDGPDMWTDYTQPDGTTGLELGGQQKSVCLACQQNATIVISDGNPEADNSVPASKMLDLLVAAGARHADNTLVTFSPNAGGVCPNNSRSGGINYCDQFSSTKCACDAVVDSRRGPDIGNYNFMDDIAFFLANTDLRTDMPGAQVMKTHTIGYGDNSPMLQSIAKAGNGIFARADSPQQLQAALIAAVGNVLTRATSFSSASIASVQSAGAGNTVVLPRFSPQKDKPWIGKLYRFNNYVEFVEDNDFNGDTDKNDIFITDSTNAQVVEDNNGNFVRASSGGAATPYWEAGSKLVGKGHAARSVYTLDTDGDGAFTNADGAAVAFTVANEATLRPYLGITGTAFCPKAVLTGTCSGGSQSGTACLNNGDCPSGSCAIGGAMNGTMLTKFGLTPLAAATLLGVLPAVTQAQLDSLCASVLIQYIRGRDLGDEDGDTDRNETRASVFGDIFHSSPIVVTAPALKKDCIEGTSTQCARTLFAQNLRTASTPIATGVAYSNACGARTGDAYDAYQNAQRGRDQVILVGANDGMVHAIHNGNSGSETCVGGRLTVPFNMPDGTSEPGDEIWALIPPDLLPRLQELVFGHAYMVDGDIMVRDVWNDDNTDGIKQQGEFHTMAVVADGRGGTAYSAFELTFSASGNLQPPNYRWMFPQPCSDEASKFGKTLLSLAPSPPPIGPVLLETANLSSPSAGPGVNRYTCTGTVGAAPLCSTNERWVVMVSGGWSPSLDKGRGVYMLDVFNGAVNGRKDNLLWKMEFDENASGEQRAATRGMATSIVAPVAMVDYGTTNEVKFDGFFDTATVGDTDGQQWVMRFFKPGRLNTTTKLIENWSGARTFEMDRYGVSPGTDDDGATSTNRKSVKNTWPFHYLNASSIQVENDALRIFGGTGNRYALLEPLAGSCRLDNPVACAKYDCGEARSSYAIRKATLRLTRNETRWKASRFQSARESASAVSDAICGDPGDTTVTAEYTKREVRSCDPQSGPTIDPGDIGKAKVVCGKDAFGNFNCRRTDAVLIQTDDLAFTASSSQPKTAVLSTLGMNRFYGILAYGGSDPTRSFEEDRTSSSGSYKTAKDFDDTRTTDRTVANPDNGDLVNVTGISCTTAPAATGCTFVAPSTSAAGNPADGMGWFYEYNDLAHRTASASGLLLGSALWNAMVPTAASVSCAATPGVATLRLYQASDVSGLPNIAAGFLATTGTYSRYLERSALAPPPTMSTSVQVNKVTGKVRYSLLLLEPGASQATEANVAAGADVLQNLYELPITRALHNCRHNPGGSVNCVEAPP